MVNKITKKEAKEILGISDRTIERYVKKGYLAATYDHGKPSKVYFDEQQVGELKEFLASSSRMPDKEKMLGKAVIGIFDYFLKGTKENKDSINPEKERKQENFPLSMTGLVKIPRVDELLLGNVNTENQALLFEYEVHLDKLKNEIIQLLPSLKPYLIELLRDTFVNIETKLLLTVEEVVLLSGIPQEEVELAIEKKQLKVVKFVSHLRVRRSDLEEYIKNLPSSSSNEKD